MDDDAETDAPTPVCVVCNRAFAVHEGHVGDEVESCDVCLHND